MDVIIKAFGSGPVGSNCYICSYGTKAFVIDPGCDISQIKRYTEQNRLEIEYIFLTHAHYDHVAGLDEVRIENPDAKVYAHPLASEALGDPVSNGSIFFGVSKTFDPADDFFEDGQIIDFYGMDIQIMFTPGHSRGSVCIFFDGNIFTGDTLFKESIGRSDLPGGDPRELGRSLKKLFSEREDGRVYPGHGEDTTIGHEKKNNPYIRGGAW